MIREETVCGKTSFCVRLLANVPSLCTDTNFRQRSSEECDGVSRLVVLNDVMNEVYSSDLCEICTKGIYHTNIRNADLVSPMALQQSYPST
jgi:hypothetical protein